MTYDPSESPTNAELEAAWQTLIALGVAKIADVSLGELGRVIEGGPAHDANRYSDAERRFARALVVMRAEFAKALRVSGGATAEHYQREMAKLDLELAQAKRALADLRATYQTPVVPR